MPKPIACIVVLACLFMTACTSAESRQTRIVRTVDGIFRSSEKQPSYIRTQMLAAAIKNMNYSVEIDYVGIHGGFYSAQGFEFEGHLARMDPQYIYDLHALILFETPTEIGCISNCDPRYVLPDFGLDNLGGNGLVSALIFPKKTTLPKFDLAVTKGIQGPVWEMNESWDGSSVAAVKIKSSGSAKRYLAINPVIDNLPRGQPEDQGTMDVYLSQLLSIWDDMVTRRRDYAREPGFGAPPTTDPAP